MIFRTVLLLALLALAGCQSAKNTTKTDASAGLPNAVGLKQKLLYDDLRNRRLPLTIWYPAEGNSEQASVNDGIYIRHFGRRNTKALEGKRTLVLLSHGTGGTASSLSWIAEYLAGHGYWVIGVDHPYDSWPNATTQGLLEVWKRPQDLTEILNQLSEQPGYTAHIDFNQVTVLGHSSGGYTALALAGAQYDTDALTAHCQSPEAMPACALANTQAVESVDFSRSQDNFRDPRITALVALAPAVTPGLTPSSLKAISIPTLVISSERDELLARTPTLATRHIDSHEAIELSQAGHFVYLSECNELGKQVAAKICTDPEGVNRAAHHQQLQPQILDFLQRSARSD